MSTDKKLAKVEFIMYSEKPSPTLAPIAAAVTTLGDLDGAVVMTIKGLRVRMQAYGRDEATDHLAERLCEAFSAVVVDVFNATAPAPADSERSA